jgi:hypothetical protein
MRGYTLMISLRRLALQGTALHRACATTIRNTRRIRLMFTSHHPYRDTFPRPSPIGVKKADPGTL